VSAETGATNTLFASNSNALFRSFAFEGDERARAEAFLVARGRRAAGTSRTHQFLVGDAWRPTRRTTITPQAQAFLLYRGEGASFAGARRERLTREASLEAAHLWTPRDRGALVFRYQHHALRGDFGAQAFDVAFVEPAVTHALSPTARLTLAGAALVHEQGASPLAERWGGRGAYDARGRAWKASLETSHLPDAGIPGTRTRAGANFEARFARRWSHFEGVAFDRIAVAPTPALGPGSLVRETRAEVGVRNDPSPDFLWGGKVELVRAEPGAGARQRRVSLLCFLQWTPWEDTR
jgi:hypothetical protein